MEASRPGTAPSLQEAYTSLLSHELRTPVTAVLGFLELLQDEDLRSDPALLRESLALALRRAQGLARIVEELTAFSDLTLGRDLPERTGPVRLPEVVEQAAAGRAVRLEASAEAAEAAVEADRLRVALQVLLDNATTFGTAGRDILVRASLEGEPPRLVVRVVNAGEPIPAGLEQAIFEPFRQAEDPRTRRHGGLGLGLTVPRRVAEGVGGALVLESRAPTTFRLELPLREDPLARQARELRERLALADSQALVAIRELRQMRDEARRERQSREQAEAQQLRTVRDFRAEHERAVALAGDLDRAYLATITALAKAVEARDSYTGGHVERVRSHSLVVAEALGVSDRERVHLEYGALLHDVGKIGVADAVLGKPGALDPDEWALMQRHPEIGRRLLERIALLEPALDAVFGHHECWDGAGYLTGLAANAIPLFGRIVAVADAYDAMVTDRPYRRGLPREVALAEIERGRGAQFDPDIAAAFLARQTAVTA